MALRVLVVDDSAFHRRTLARIIGTDPSLEVVGTATDGEDAIKKVASLQPDLITLDLEMPRMDGYTFLRWLMSANPRPVLVVSSQESNLSVFRALELGAADFVLKPVSGASVQLEQIERQVLAKIHGIAAARVDRLAARAAAPPPPAATAAPAAPVATPVAEGKHRLVAIGASTGGPPALQRVLSALPAGLPAAVVVSQHMPEGFTRQFAERLNRLVPFRVKEAQDADEVRPGTVLVAPGGFHLGLQRARGGRVVAFLEAPRPHERYIPSVDRMLASAAEIYRAEVVGVVLTGMGDDGAKGLSAVREHRGLTIAESEETCVVFGMPREAIRAGVVDRVLTLPEIGPAIAQACRG